MTHDSDHLRKNGLHRAGWEHMEFADSWVDPRSGDVFSFEEAVAEQTKWEAARYIGGRKNADPTS